MQQDAAINLCRSVGIPKKSKETKDFENIREIRNAAIGHPTEKTSKQTDTSFQTITRLTLNRDYFNYLVAFSKGEIRPVDVNIPDLLTRQYSDLVSILTEVFTKLKESHTQP